MKTKIEEQQVAELLRSIAGRLRAFIGNRRSAPRRPTRVPVSVSLTALKSGSMGGRTNPGASSLAPLKGRAKDLGETGIGFVLPAIRIGEHYLAGEGRRLRVVLELPTGPLAIQVAPVRYERLQNEGGGNAGYLVGARIVSIDAADHPPFAEYLRKKG